MTVHDPVSLQDGDLSMMFQGSFIPVPDLASFSPHPEEGLIPGQIHVKLGDIHLNKGRVVSVLSVSNSSDRPIQVGSHYHFVETNPALIFDRKTAHGQRLNMYVDVTITQVT